MKRTIAFLLALITIFSLAACGKKEEESFDVDDALKRSVRSSVTTYCYFNFKDVKFVDVSVTDTDVSGDLYTVKGKVTVTDGYGDKYTGKFDGVFQLSGESFTKKSLNVETPRKSS